jgi:hypothetical protein
VQNVIWRFSELKENKPDSLRANRIREDVKKKVFPVQWSTPSEFLMTEIGFKMLIPQVLTLAVEAHNNGGISSLKKIDRKINNPYDNLKLKRTDGYIMGEIDDGVRIRSACVTSDVELNMFVEVYRWLSANPEFEFGPESKTLAEYGLCDKLKADALNYQDCLADWVLNMGFADSQEDFNWEFAQVLVNEEEYSELMAQYIIGEADGEKVFEAIGFKSDNQAKACFSKHTKLATSESRNMGPALKRVKMFGEMRSLASDKIYVALFRYLRDNKPEILPKQLIAQYATVF